MFEFLKRVFRRKSAEPSDRTMLHLAQAGLRASEEQFAQLVSGVQDYAVFLLDQDGKILTWNAGAERIKGYRSEDIVGSHFSRFYPPQIAASGWPAHELRVATETGRFEEEGWRVRKDGSLFWASVVITALRDGNNQVRGFLKITRDLTQRKNAEEKLLLSEERLRLLVDRVQDYAIFMLDPEGRVATWNTGAERLKGYKAEDIIGSHFSRFYPKEVAARGWPEEELRRARADGRFEDEGWRVRKDGSLFWANVVITALQDETGVLRGFAKVTRDLTERRQAEESARRLLQEEAARQAAERAAREIEQQREQLRVTLASIGDAVVTTDDSGIVTFMNPVAVELTGWELNEAIGKPLQDVFHIIHEETGQVLECPVAMVLRENRTVALANHSAIIGKHGRKIPIEDSAAPIRCAEGAVHGTVLVFRDVSESRRAMEARMYLAAIVESSDDAIIGQSLDGRIASWNRGAQRLYGYSAEEIVGKPLTVLVPEDHPDEAPAIIERIKRGEYIEHFETQRIRKDGARVDVSLTISPVRDGDGKIIGASKIARDITARKEEDRRKNEFLALLAHELRNPLAPLRNGLQVLRLAGGNASAAEQARAMMERQLQHLVRLVDDLLDVSRISRGKLQLRKERLPLAEIVTHALEVCGSLINDQVHELKVTPPSEVVYVDADKTRLAQALCNLLSNAVKYSEPGTLIQLTVEVQGREAIIRVKDEGVGIPPQMLPRVFDLFWQVDRTLEKSQGGLGVGLAIVKQLVEMHGGHVEAHSEGPSMGSEFVIRLPAILSVKEEQPSPSGESAAPTRKLRILVTDDNADSAASLSMMLRLMGHDVHLAHDGVEAVDAAASFRPDVILMDIGMPRMNGYEACRRIRGEPWGAPIIIIALTGWGQEEDKRRSREAGFNSHLVKPVEPATLEKLLQEMKSQSASA
jgi:PAS domain S-box-containing protein